MHLHAFFFAGTTATILHLCCIRPPQPHSIRIRLAVPRWVPRTHGLQARSPRPVHAGPQATGAGAPRPKCLYKWSTWSTNEHQRSTNGAHGAQMEHMEHQQGTHGAQTEGGAQTDHIWKISGAPTEHKWSTWSTNGAHGTPMEHKWR